MTTRAEPSHAVEIRGLSLARVLRRPTATLQSQESAALVAGTASFAIALALALPLFWWASVPISGPGSVAQFVAIVGAVASGVTFALGCVLVRTADDTQRLLRWFDIAATALAHALIALIGWIGIGSLIELSFLDARLYPLSAAMLGGIAVALTVYVTFLSAVRLSPMGLSFVLAIFLVVGIFASTLSASDPHWWQENLSALGMTDDLSALAFNLTLVVGGVIVTIIANYATVGLARVTEAQLRARRLVRLAIVLIGVFLAGVGTFPTDDFHTVHNTFALGMVVVFASVVIGLRWLIPAAPRVFLYLGYVYLAVVALLGVLYATGYYPLTAVELVAAILVFSWIILFLRNLATPQEAAHG